MADKGPLLATFKDGTKIYQNGVETWRGYRSLKLGVYSFNQEFNPNTGSWTDAGTGVVSSYGRGSISILPNENGLQVEFGGRLGVVDLALVVY
jgi:hypothetical protein